MSALKTSTHIAISKDLRKRIQKAEKYLLDLQQLDQTLTVEEDKLL